MGGKGIKPTIALDDECGKFKSKGKNIGNSMTYDYFSTWLLIPYIHAMHNNM